MPIPPPEDLQCKFMARPAFFVPLQTRCNESNTMVVSPPVKAT